MLGCLRPPPLHKWSLEAELVAAAGGGRRRSLTPDAVVILPGAVEGGAPGPSQLSLSDSLVAAPSWQGEARERKSEGSIVNGKSLIKLYSSRMGKILIFLELSKVGNYGKTISKSGKK